MEQVRVTCITETGEGDCSEQGYQRDTQMYLTIRHLILASRCDGDAENTRECPVEVE